MTASSAPFLRLCLTAGLLSLGACDTFGHIQKPPDMSAPGQLRAIPPTVPTESPMAVAYRPREEPLEPMMAGSLWRPGARSFFRDQRARAVGDLLTVEIEIDHSVSFDNQTQLQRTSSQNQTISGLFGAQGMLSRLVRTVGGAAAPLVDVGGGSTSNGQGQINRAEKIKLQVAATVIRRLPSGNLEIAGSQEIRVNDELRELQLRGLIRPEDIQYNNRIDSEKIAEARIIYGGRGISSDVQRPHWGQQVLERILPF